MDSKPESVNPNPVTHWGILGKKKRFKKKATQLGKGDTCHCSYLGISLGNTGDSSSRWANISVSSLTSRYKQNSWPAIAGKGDLQYQSIWKWENTSVEVTTLKCSGNRKGEGHSVLLLTFLLLPEHEEGAILLRLHSLQTEVPWSACQQTSCDCSKRLSLHNQHAAVIGVKTNGLSMTAVFDMYEPNILNFNILPISLTPEMASLSLVTRDVT